MRSEYRRDVLTPSPAVATIGGRAFPGASGGLDP